ncbi:Helicase loader DnaB [Streptococcus sp. DD11]|uniref:DNA helicase n=1 Tax=Streptococcus sp. DD11 TaxID=1777879 RepID=UPI000794AEE1|nr:DNA helicase [Streptococcus sp. DD11]KXT84761.1 Helicase loader DnaB [Streptococcus sp. DD11]
MKPNHHFSFLRNHLVSQDTGNFSRLYLPILGREAAALYLYLLAFWDNGQKEHLFSHILNHLDFGMDILESSLDRLSAMRLLTIYEEEGAYVMQLYPPLSADEFFQHNVYSKLLEKKIGEAAAEALRPESASGQKRIKPFMQVFGLENQQQERPRQVNDFDLGHFKQRMAQENLRFADEKEDVLELFAIAEQKKWTWYETYLLAKETAVSQVISTKRMKQKLAQRPVDSEFSQQERSIIREAKSKAPMMFLAEIKQTRQAAITRTERKLLQDLAELGLLDEVINVILLLTFNKVDSANVNEKYALKAANDFAYQGVKSAEEAVLKIRERHQQGSKKPAFSKGQTSNVPDWSQPDYKNETSAEKQAELEEQKRRLLAKLEGGSD